MLRALIRTFFRGVLALLVLLLALALYVLYRSGGLPVIEEAVEEATIVGSVKAALALHRDLSQRTLRVEADAGRVVLRGRVGTAGEKSAAEDLARSVDGVETVENELEVDAELESESASDPLSLGARLDDVALLAKIRAALRLDRETKSLDLDVHVRDGEVRVRGRVPSEEVREKVRERVAMIGGVDKLELELEVEVEETGDLSSTSGL